MEQTPRVAIRWLAFLDMEGRWVLTEDNEWDIAGERDDPVERSNGTSGEDDHGTD